MKKLHPRLNRSGSILLISVVMMFIVTAAMMGVLTVTANSLHLCSRQREGATAFNIAESGAEIAAMWLKDQAYPPSTADPFDPFDGPQDMDDGTYTVTIVPAADNPTSYLKTYRIVCVGDALGATKTIELVVKQASFGRYAYFTNREVSSISGGAIWWKAGERVDGPAHSNNYNGSNFNVNYNGSSAPIFLDMVTGSGPTINYTPGRPQNETTFKKVFLDGSKGYKLNVTPIMLPPSTDIQKNAAWGNSGGYPTTTGVYLRTGANGGVYVRGDAAMQLSVNGFGNQVVTVTQGSNTTAITFDKVTGAVTSTGPLGSGSVSSAACLGTGVVYCTGNITSLKGTVADNWVMSGDIRARSAMTIANDVNAGKYMKVTDNLVYNTRPDKTQDRTATANLLAGTLGLVSKDLRISSSAPRNLEIDAVCLAGGQNTSGGSFYVENYDSKTPTGTLKVLGGIIQKDRGPVGTFNSSTGQMVTGYAKNYSYDPRLATDPPPFYPTTGQYDRLSWQILPNQ